MEILANDLLDLVGGGADSGKPAGTSATGPNNISITCPPGYSPSVTIVSGALNGRTGIASFGGQGSYTTYNCVAAPATSGSGYGSSYGSSASSAASAAASAGSGSGGVKQPTHVSIDEH